MAQCLAPDFWYGTVAAISLSSVTFCVADLGGNNVVIQSISV
jgi:hypothetical protein